MKKEEKIIRYREALQEIQWLEEEGKIFRMLTESEELCDIEEFEQAVSLLEQKGAYTILYLLIMRYRANSVVEQALREFLIPRIKRMFEELDPEELCSEFLSIMKKYHEKEEGSIL